MNTVIQKRLALLREEMKRAGVDYYMIPTADYHNSEYVDEYFKTREYFSGFTGSNGTLVVGQDMAGLWTDGRYFIRRRGSWKEPVSNCSACRKKACRKFLIFCMKRWKKGRLLVSMGGRSAAKRDADWRKNWRKRKLNCVWPGSGGGSMDRKTGKTVPGHNGASR